MLKKEGNSNWLQQEYDREKKNVEQLKREVGDREWKEQPTISFEPSSARKTDDYMQQSSHKKESFLGDYVKRSLFGIAGFIISWAVVYTAVKYLILRFYLPFYFFPPMLYTLITFFIWGAVFLAVRRKVLEG